MDYSTSRPSPKAALTRATAFYQCVISSVSVSLFYSVSYLPGPPTTSTAPAAAFDAAAFSFHTYSFSLHAYTNHHFSCSALIPEGPSEQWFLRRLTAPSISTYVGTESYTWNGSTDTGMFSPLGGTWRYRSTHSAYPLEGNLSGRWRAVDHSPIPPLHTVP